MTVYRHWSKEALCHTDIFHFIWFQGLIKYVGTEFILKYTELCRDMVMTNVSWLVKASEIWGSCVSEEVDHGLGCGTM
jgi:hypothetical protein